jgi:hypothetical protein
MRAHRLLRRFTQSTRLEAFPCHCHPIAASFEPGEIWFYDYWTRKMIPGERPAEPQWHPESQPAVRQARCPTTGSLAFIDRRRATPFADPRRVAPGVHLASASSNVVRRSKKCLKAPSDRRRPSLPKVAVDGVRHKRLTVLHKFPNRFQLLPPPQEGYRNPQNAPEGDAIARRPFGPSRCSRQFSSRFDATRGLTRATR